MSTSSAPAASGVPRVGRVEPVQPGAGVGEDVVDGPAARHLSDSGSSVSTVRDGTRRAVRGGRPVRHPGQRRGVGVDAHRRLGPGVQHVVTVARVDGLGPVGGELLRHQLAVAGRPDLGEGAGDDRERRGGGAVVVQLGALRRQPGEQPDVDPGRAVEPGPPAAALLELDQGLPEVGLRGERAGQRAELVDVERGGDGSGRGDRSMLMVVPLGGASAGRPGRVEAWVGRACSRRGPGGSVSAADSRPDRNAARGRRDGTGAR